MAMRQNNWGETRVEVTVDRHELIKRIKANRELHQVDYKSAIALWQKAMDETLKGIDALNIVEFPEILLRMSEHCPKSYLAEYDDFVELFEMSMNDTILLDSESFRRFCKDEWNWKHDLYNNHYYKLVREAKGR